MTPSRSPQPSATPVPELSYKDALARLQALVRRVESAEIDVDELADAVREANILVNDCRRKLRAADAEVARALDDLRRGGAEFDAADDEDDSDDDSSDGGAAESGGLFR